MYLNEPNSYNLYCIEYCGNKANGFFASKFGTVAEVIERIPAKEDVVTVEYMGIVRIDDK